MNDNTLPSRKRDHVELVATADVGFRTITPGFDRIRLDYVALPELNFEDITTTCEVFGRQVQFPVVIASMTGGYEEATKINADLAAVCRDMNIGLGVGSMRAAITDERHRRSFSIAREVAPKGLLLANIGIVQCIEQRNLGKGALRGFIARIVDMIEANALYIHINALQELLQPEGEPRFRGALDTLVDVVDVCNVPVVVKEVGAGIGHRTMTQLRDAGVRHVDVAGAGGTSWAGVEILRRDDRADVEELWDVGIPTVDCLIASRQFAKDSGMHLYASGGIRSGTDIAKSLVLGATATSAARPVLKALREGGAEAAIALLQQWELRLRQWMFITGSATIDDLRSASYSHL